MTFLKLIFSKISRTTLFVLGTIAAASAAFYKGYAEGIEREQLKQKEKEHDRQKMRADVAEEVNAMSDASVDDELRKHATKRDK